PTGGGALGGGGTAPSPVAGRPLGGNAARAAAGWLAMAWYVNVTVRPGSTVPMFSPERARPWESGLWPATSGCGVPSTVVVPCTYERGGGGSSFTTTSWAGFGPSLATVSVTVT